MHPRSLYLIAATESFFESITFGGLWPSRGLILCIESGAINYINKISLVSGKSMGVKINFPISSTILPEGSGNIDR
jgi:hypothetical protein